MTSLRLFTTCSWATGHGLLLAKATALYPNCGAIQQQASKLKQHASRQLHILVFAHSTTVIVQINLYY